MLRKLKLTSLEHRLVDPVKLTYEIPVLHRVVEQHGLYVFRAVFGRVVASLLGWILLESQGEHKM